LDLSSIVSYLWAANVLVEVAICALLFIRGYFRRLPFFTAYLALNLCQAAFLYAIYHYYGDKPSAIYIDAWLSEAVTLVARLCATVELLRLALKPYRGIWALTWRLLAVVSPIVLVLVGLASHRDPHGIVMEADRGYHLIFAVAIVLCLVVMHYYPIKVESTYKTLLSGFCWYSCVKILIDTPLQGFLSQRDVQYSLIWQIVAMSAYLAVLILWGSALANPLPALQKQVAMLADSAYSNFSAAINRQLRALNRGLMNFWKIEGPQQ
jgi:hypothetical protein